MTETFRRGLVVGKFAPLHRGHEHLLRTALARCDEVFALSYAQPAHARCDAAARTRWMAELFPTVRHAALDPGPLTGPLGGAWPAGIPQDDAGDEVQRAFAADVVRHLFGVPMDAVFTSETYGAGFAQALGRAQRAWATGTEEVHHVSVDAGRTQVPISATRLRRDITLHADFLSPVVRADFVRRICLVGGESSGKTTLAAALAARHNTRWVAEYGREHWERKAGRLQPDDMVAIAERQVERERLAARSARTYLFCDTGPIVTLCYCDSLFGTAPPRVQALATQRHDLYVLCAPDFMFVQDGTRQDAAFRAWQTHWYEAALARLALPTLQVHGDIEARCAQVDAALQRLS
jgi:HTH-type transcriptional repressor of NAD biosynthesis genes